MTILRDLDGNCDVLRASIQLRLHQNVPVQRQFREYRRVTMNSAFALPDCFRYRAQSGRGGNRPHPATGHTYPLKMLVRPIEADKRGEHDATFNA
jgi:hypothetical protein